MADQTGIVDLQESFCKGSNEKEDFALAVQPMELLNAAPLSVNILGTLCLIATGDDFSLKVEGADFEFKLLKAPESFRASLCQISNEGYFAFLEADTQMNKIRMMTNEIPEKLKNSLQILFNGSVKEVKQYLPIQLGRIKEISEECEKDAEKVVEEFTKVMKTLGEMQVATLAKQGDVEGAKKQAEANRIIEAAELKHYEEEVKRDEDAREKFEKTVEKNNEEYKKAFDSIPGGLAMVGFAAAETGLKVGGTLAMAYGGSMLLSAASVGESVAVAGSLGATALAKKGQDVYNDYKQHQAKSDDAPNAVSEADGDLYRRADQYLNLQVGGGMEAILKETENEVMNFSLAHGKDEGGMSLTDLGNRIQSVQKKFKENAEKASPDLLDKIMRYSSKMHKIIDALSKIDKSKAGMENEVKEQRRKFQKLLEQIKRLGVEQTARTGSNTLQRPGPGMLDKLKQTFTDSTKAQTLTENALKTAHLKVECSKEQLRSSEKRLDEIRAKAQENRKKKMEIENQLAEYNLQTESLPELLNMIQDGLKAMGELKEEWSKMLRFFTHISTFIGTALGPPMKQFVQYSETARGDRIQDQDFTMSEVIQQQIFDFAKEAGKQAFVVNRISLCYTDISKKHLMPLVARLNTMLAMDKVADKNKIAQEKGKLQKASKDAREAIEELTANNIKKAQHALNNRVEELDTLQKTLLPPLSPQKMVETREEAQQMTSGKVAKVDTSNFDI